MMECKKSSDLSKLGASLGSTDLYDMVMFSLMTACRFSECKKLRWEHVSFEDNKLTFVERKNGEDHHFSIKDPQLHKLLQDRFQNAESAMVFPKPEVRGSFERACKRAGINDFRWHDLGHTSISYVLMSGGTLKEAQQHAGHKSYQSTLRYAHLDTTTTEKNQQHDFQPHQRNQLMKERLIELVQLRNEILELLPYKANVYPVNGNEWGDRLKMYACRDQISKLKELGYNKNRLL